MNDAETTLNDYQHAAVETAIFPQHLGLLYPTLGLCGEAGEVAEVVKKIHRDDGGALGHESLKRLRDELGDCLWYLAMVATVAGLSLGEVAEENLRKLRDRQARGVMKGSGNER
jgi:NTP pyrophosphatase (non-canonical NTP hydrolase)